MQATPCKRKIWKLGNDHVHASRVRIMGIHGPDLLLK